VIRTLFVASRGETTIISRDLPHPIEIVGHGNLTCQKAEPSCGRRSIESRHFDQRLSCFGDHERLALGSAIDQP